MTKDKLQLAGIFVFISAALSIPLLILIIMSSVSDSGSFKFISNTVYAGYVALWVYIYNAFQELLNKKYNFHDLNGLIQASIWLNVIGAVLAFIPFLDLLNIPLGLVFGIIMIIKGVKLQNVPNDMYGYKKPLAILTIIGGVFTLTILLFALAVLVGIITDILLGLIFFKAASEVSSTKAVAKSE